MKLLAFLTLLAIGIGKSYAQTPVEYMQDITKVENALSKKYVSYISAASHRGKMKKVERKREDLINSINEARMKINDLPSYNGDKTIRDSAVNYLKIMYRVFTQDYEKLVNMEEIAEQSYDDMEAYVLACEKASEKLHEASQNYSAAYKQFAKNNNVTLVNSTSELDEKLKTIDEVQNYQHQVYLIFFKAYKQESYYMAALASKNTNAMEQNRNALLRYSEEGIEKLKDLKTYKGDKSVENICRRLLDFYKDEAEKHFPLLAEFLLKADNFEKMKTAFESSSKTREDVDKYNKAVNDINKSLEAYNRTNAKLNEQRSTLLTNFDETEKMFLDTHMPY